MTQVEDPFHQVIESFYLETEEHLFFAAKGLVHPPDRFNAILRYVPVPDSLDRQKDGIGYRRVYHFDEQEAYLKEHYPHYLAFDPICQATFQSVPRQQITRVYDPRQRLLELTRQPERDEVEEPVVSFASLLQEEAEVPLSALGISGSVLIGLHTPQSDLDFMVHGAENCRKVYQALKRLLDGRRDPEIVRLDERGFLDLYSERVPDTRMALGDFRRVEKDKVNHGHFRGRLYFIRFLKERQEVEENYGDFRYTPSGRTRIEATLRDDREAIFTPCCYPLADVRFLEGGPEAEIREIVSFRGRFCEQASTGDRVMAVGTVEQVQDKAGRKWFRLILGNHPDDILVLRS